jgi:hypothetical protein
MIYMITFSKHKTKAAISANPKAIQAFTIAAVMNKTVIEGSSNKQSKGRRFPIIFDLCLSFILPAITSKTNQNAIKRKGNGTTSPGGGIH